MSNPEKVPVKTAALLIEIGCEELPPKSLPALASALLSSFSNELEKSGLCFDTDTSRVYYTPRRLALLMTGVSERQADQVLERRGPAVVAAYDENNQPTAAAKGFARSVGKSVDALETIKTDQGEWLFCRLKKPGEQLQKLVFPMLERVLKTLPIAKPMRWASNDFSFVRPVHWLVVMHGENLLDGSLLGLTSGRTTRGHRIHSPGPHEIDTATDYEQMLETACVVVDQHKRKEMIKQQVIELGLQAGGEALIDDALLDEVSNLVEWPRALCGSFDEEFLAVPPEALTASMQDHQKFFPVVKRSNKSLMARFIAVANLESQNMDTVRKGFERVIRPRLADADFFWNQDKLSSTDSWLEQLDRIIFQKKLGSVGDKSRRIAAISAKIAKEAKLDHALAARAGLLCKYDLVSHMVGEFPELQGIMGRYYSINSGEPPEVSQAIGEHYLPVFSGDRLPGQVIGQIVAIADRLDTLTGIFTAGLKPTGNKDPFALRRAAVGLIRILLDAELDIKLDKLLEIAALVLQSQLTVPAKTRMELRGFILERTKYYLRDQGYNIKLINAALDAPLSTLADLVLRLNALRDFMQHDDASALSAANKRIGNILRKAEMTTIGDIDENLLIIAEEQQLFDAIRSITKKLNDLYKQSDYTAALTILAGLSASIEAFFEHVMVMVEDAGIRRNRLTLLARLKGLFDQVANLALV